MNTTPSTHAINPHAIRFPDGQFYMGPDWIGMGKEGVKRADNSSSRGPICSAFSYTEARAYEIIAAEPHIFQDCVIVALV